MSLPLLVLIFVGAAAAVWTAGIKVSETTDILSVRLGLGDALGGLVILAIVTNLPEIAILVSGAMRGSMTLAVGNILGGIAAQTVVLALLDRFGTRKGGPLTYRAASLLLVLEGLLVVGILGLVLVGTQMPKDLIFARVTPVAGLIGLSWVLGVWGIAKFGHRLPWQNSGRPEDSGAAPRGSSQHATTSDADSSGQSTAKVGAIFGAGALVTLAAGVVLEVCSDAIADKMNMSGAVFGATVLAAATSLPELSTGIKSVNMNDVEMAVGDIFGGNAFLPALFLAATMITGKAVLPHATSVDIYLTAVGIVLTVVYMAGLLFRPSKRVCGMGVDSFAVVLLYAASITVLPFLG